MGPPGNSEEFSYSFEPGSPAPKAGMLGQATPRALDNVIKEIYLNNFNIKVYHYKRPGSIVA